MTFPEKEPNTAIWRLIMMDCRALEAASGKMISRHTWRAWMQQGRIPFVQLGRRKLVERETFEALIRAGRVEAR